MHQSIRSTQIKILNALKNPYHLGYISERLKDLLAPQNKIIYVSSTEHENWLENRQMDQSAFEISPIHWSVEHQALIINLNQYSDNLDEIKASSLMHMWFKALVHPLFIEKAAASSWLYEEELDTKDVKKNEESQLLISHFNQSIEKALQKIITSTDTETSIFTQKMLFQLKPSIWLEAYFEGHEDSISRAVIAYQVARLTPQVQQAIRSWGIEKNHDPLQLSILRIGYEKIDTIKKVYPEKGITSATVLHNNEVKELIMPLDAEIASCSSLTIAHEVSHLFQNMHFLKITDKIAEKLFMKNFYKHIKADDNYARAPDFLIRQIIDQIKVGLRQTLDEPGAELIVRQIFKREFHTHPSISGIRGYYRYGEKLIARLGKKKYAEILFGDHNEHWYAKRLERLTTVLAETGLQAICEKAALELKIALRKPNIDMAIDHLQIMNSPSFWVNP